VAPLSIAEQDRRIRTAWPTFRTIIAGRRLGIWRGVVQGLSCPYQIEIVYARNRSGDPVRFDYAWFPEVTVLDPPICRRADNPGDPIPHVYVEEGRDKPVLCVFDPRAGGWKRDQAIADTILVWTASWLRFYEAWQATGIWTGGSAQHGRMARRMAKAAETEMPLSPTPQAGSFILRLMSAVSTEVLSVLLSDCPVTVPGLNGKQQVEAGESGRGTETSLAKSGRRRTREMAA
jgi:hypothetical protein